jgi:hypothetical protein
MAIKPRMTMTLVISNIAAFRALRKVSGDQA